MGRKISLSDIETQFTRSLSSPQPESQFWELCIFQPFILLQVLISCFQKLHILTFWNNCPLKIADQSQNIPLCWDVKIESKSETTSLFLRKNIQWQPSLVRLTTTNEFGDPAGEACADLPRGGTVLYLNQSSKYNYRECAQSVTLAVIRDAILAVPALVLPTRGTHPVISCFRVITPVEDG